MHFPIAQSAAEIVKHFKILVTCFSVMVSRSAGIRTYAVTFRFSQHGAQGVRERVCVLELFIRTGSITETQRGFRLEPNQQEAPSPNAIRRWVRQWREEGSVTCKKPPVGRPQFAHLTKLPECWRPSAAVRGDLHASTLKLYACLIGVYGASCVVT